MLAFIEWIVHRDLVSLLRLLESADYFEPTAYNAAFDNELQKLAQSQHDPKVQQQVAELRGFDWGNYLARSLARAGFRGDELQDEFHNIVVKLLLNPGKLFAGWNTAKHGPLQRRYFRSVWNAIRNAQEKIRNRRRWVVTADPAVMAEREPGRKANSGLLDGFRKMVAEKLGPLAVAVFDQRLAGEDTKDLAGRADLGRASAYGIKRTVQALKGLAQQSAALLGGTEFAARVAKAMEDEATTVSRRHISHSREAQF